MYIKNNNNFINDNDSIYGSSFIDKNVFYTLNVWRRTA